MRGVGHLQAPPGQTFLVTHEPVRCTEAIKISQANHSLGLSAKAPRAQHVGCTMRVASELSVQILCLQNQLHFPEEKPLLQVHEDSAEIFATA